MKPEEIAAHMRSIPPLRTLLGRKLWKFLRDEVEEVPSSGQRTYIPIPCTNCGTGHIPLYFSPYSAPDIFWCLPCIIRAFFNPDVERYNPYQDTEIEGSYCWIIAEEEMPDDASWD